MANSGKARLRKGRSEQASTTKGTNGRIHSTLWRFAPFILMATACIYYFSPDTSQPMTNVGIQPRVYTYRLVQRYPHDPLAFTQGLLWLNGSLFESTGLNRRSGVREVRLEDGKVMRQARNKDDEFGEGLVHWNGDLLQLLWRQGDGVRYSFQAGENGHLKRKEKRFKTPRNDGWGLESYNGSLIMTDSGSEVFFLDPESFKLRRKMRVYDAQTPIEMLNELEVIDAEIWANIFGNNCIARVSPETGYVVGWVIFDDLMDRRQAHSAALAQGIDPPDVFNGIAWDPDAKRLFVTGKLWPSLFEVEVIPDTSTTLQDARARCIPTENVFRRR